MNIRHFIIFLPIAVVLSSCWAANFPAPVSNSFGNMETLEAFIGENSNKIIEELGLPDQKLVEDDRQYLVYQSTNSSGAGVLFLVWVPIAVGPGHSPKFHCLRFEIDFDDKVRDFHIASEKMVDSSSITDYYRWKKCRELLWGGTFYQGRIFTSANPSDSKLGEYLASRLNQPEETYDPVKDLMVYDDFYWLAPSIALTSLCNAVDWGDRNAMYALAEEYELGMAGFIEEDHIRAYVWFSLSGSTKEELKSFADYYLSPSDVRKAEQSLFEWQPGQCKQELGLSH